MNLDAFLYFAKNIIINEHFILLNGETGDFVLTLKDSERYLPLISLFFCGENPTFNLSLFS